MDINTSRLLTTLQGDGLRERVETAADTSRRGATVEAVAPLSPAAIYHPSDEVPEGPSDFDLYMQVGRPPRADGSAPRSANAIAEDIAGAERDLSKAFFGVWYNLGITDPALAQQKFGFSVDGNGKLVVLDTQYAFNDKQRERLTSLLNQSQALVDAAKRMARLNIEQVESSDVNDIGRFQLDMDNYAQTIDLGLVVGYRAGDRDRFYGTWTNQLWNKGEVRYGQWIQIVDNGRRLF